MIFFMPIESPERVTKVGILTRKLVWMVWMVWLRFGHLCPPMSFFEFPSCSLILFAAGLLAQWWWIIKTLAFSISLDPSLLLRFVVIGLYCLDPSLTLKRTTPLSSFSLSSLIDPLLPNSSHPSRAPLITLSPFYSWSLSVVSVRFKLMYLQFYVMAKAILWLYPFIFWQIEGLHVLAWRVTESAEFSLRLSMRKSESVLGASCSVQHYMLSGSWRMPFRRSTCPDPLPLLVKNFLRFFQCQGIPRGMQTWWLQLADLATICRP